MKCKNCGHENTEKAETCSSCGEKFTKEATTDTTASFRPVREEKAAIKITPEKEHALIVAKGSLVGERFVLNSDQVGLGRDPGSDIFLDDITVSRNHAKISTDGKEVIVSDAGSLNGTYVNSERVEKAILKHGDEIQIGKFKLIFSAKQN